jgi:hypothetical protein
MPPTEPDEAVVLGVVGVWSAPGWMEASLPGRVRGYGTPEEVPTGAA